MSRSEARRPAEVLMVENTSGDLRLLRQVLKEGSAPKRIRVSRGNEEAMAFLRRPSESRRPDLIILSLGGARAAGSQLVDRLKSDPALGRIPILVMASRESEEELDDLYALHANCCMIRPTGKKEAQTAGQAIEKFWLSTVRLPAD